MLDQFLICDASKWRNLDLVCPFLCCSVCCFDGEGKFGNLSFCQRSGGHFHEKSRSQMQNLFNPFRSHPWCKPQKNILFMTVCVGQCLLNCYWFWWKRDHMFPCRWRVLYRAEEPMNAASKVSRGQFDNRESRDCSRWTNNKLLLARLVCHASVPLATHIGATFPVVKLAPIMRPSQAE